MATIINDRDILLQAAGTRLLSVTLPSNITVVDAVSALAGLATIASNNVLSKGEKPYVVQQYNAIINDQSGIDSSADTFSISRVAYDATVTALTTYLTGLSPAYTDYTQDTTIVGSTFNTAFNSVYTARQALLNAIDARIISTAYIAPSAATDVVSTTASNVTVTYNSATETTFATISYTALVTGPCIITLTGQVSNAGHTVGGGGGPYVYIGTGIRILNSTAGTASQSVLIPNADSVSTTGTTSHGTFALSTPFNLTQGTTYSFQARIYSQYNGSDTTVSTAEMRLEAIKKMNQNIYSVYKLDTGLFTGTTYQCATEHLDINIPDNCSVVIGTYDPQSQKVDIATGLVIDYTPLQPSDNYAWDTNSRRWVYVPTLDDIKATKLVEINSMFNVGINAVSANYPDDEVKSWIKQEDEARAYTADNTVQTPLLSALAEARGVSLSDLIPRVIAKANAYTIITGNLIGTRQGLQDSINAATTQDEVETIKWPSSSDS